MGKFRIAGFASLLILTAALSAFGGVRIQVIHGRPVTSDVYVNGSGPYRFLVDTGTSMNHLDPKLASRLGIRPGFRTELISSAGLVMSTGAAHIAVRLGEAEASDQSFLFSGMDAVHESFRDVQGVLGQEFLSHFDYLLDLKGGRLEFGSQEPQPEKSRVAIRTVTGRPAIETNLGTLVLDSGASDVTLYNVKHAPLTHEIRTMAGNQGVGVVPRKLVIDGRTVWRGDAVAIPDSAENETHGLLPLSIFRSVYISNSEGYAAFDQR